MLALTYWVILTNCGDLISARTRSNWVFSCQHPGSHPSEKPNEIHPEARTGRFLLSFNDNGLDSASTNVCISTSWRSNRRDLACLLALPRSLRCHDDGLYHCLPYTLRSWRLQATRNQGSESSRDVFVAGKGFAEDQVWQIWFLARLESRRKSSKDPFGHTHGDQVFH